MRRSILLILAVATASIPAHADDAATPAPSPGPPAAPVRSRVPDYIGLAVTGGLTIATIGAFWHRHTLTERALDDTWKIADRDEHQATKNASERWRTASGVLFGATLVSAAVTTFLWTRHNAPAFGVQVTGDGAAVSLGGGF